MKIQLNEAPIDRVVRVIVGFALLAVAFTGAVVAPWVYAAWLVGAIALVTGIVGFCPLYAVLGVSTKAGAR